MDVDQKAAVAALVDHLRDYAQSRANDVARGAETPRLSATLLQKYGRGVADAVVIIFDDRRAADPIWQLLDAETSRIDPAWSHHERDRWAARPADLS